MPSRTAGRQFVVLLLVLFLVVSHPAEVLAAIFLMIRRCDEEYK